MTKREGYGHCLVSDSGPLSAIVADFPQDLVGHGRSVNRRLSLRWFEPNTCHYLRKRPVSWGYPASRAVAFGAAKSRCVHESPAVSSGARIYSGQRPRLGTRPGGVFWADCSGRGGGSGRLTKPLVPGFRWPAVLGEEPARLSGDHWWVESLTHVAHGIHGQSLPGHRSLVRPTTGGGR
jgi:hypothetical protein